MSFKYITALAVCIIALGTALNCAHAAQTPVQHYDFTSDYTDARNLHDMYGAGSPAIDNGTLSLDGSSYLQSANINGPAPNGITHNNFSVSGFFKAISLTGSTTLFSMSHARFSGSTWPDNVFSVTVNSDGSLKGSSRATTNWQTNAISGAGLVEVNEIYHFAFVYDGSNNQNRLYLNGSLVASVSHTYNEPIADYAASTDERMYIGAINEGVGADNFYAFFNGYIDELKVYQTALSTQDVIDEYTANAHQIPYPVAVPEPSTILLLMSAVGALLKRVKRI
ncbi:MAG: LamG-like jellyroll fold domain-containing protein [Candidatus Auribacterota bacterium]